jgi:hypothetical protein
VYAASIVSLNAFGLFAACTLGFFASVWFLIQEPRAVEALLIIAVSGAGITVAVVAYLMTSKWRGLQHTQPQVPRSLLGRVRRSAVRFCTSLLVFQNGNVMSRSFAFAITSQVSQLLILWLVSTAISAEISLTQLALYGPLVKLISVAPVSIGGFGGGQAAFVVFFARLGVEAQKAFAVSFITNVLAMCLYLVGGFVYVLGAPHGRPPVMHSKEADAQSS